MVLAFLFSLLLRIEEGAALREGGDDGVAALPGAVARCAVGVTVGVVLAIAPPPPPPPLPPEAAVATLALGEASLARSDLAPLGEASLVRSASSAVTGASLASSGDEGLK